MQERIKATLRRSSCFPWLKSAYEHHHPARRRHARERIHFYRRFVRPGQLCFDVGANMGNRTEAFLGIGARVIAIEPQPICIPTLLRRFGRHPAFALVPVGVGDKQGIATMRLSESHTLSSLSGAYVERTTYKQWLAECEVRVTTLDAVIGVFGVPHFMKVDIEGYEAVAFAGLSQPVPTVSVEFNPQVREVGLEALEQLADLGPYQFSFSRGETLRLGPWGSLADAKRVVNEEPTFGDFYCALPGAPCTS